MVSVLGVTIQLKSSLQESQATSLAGRPGEAANAGVVKAPQSFMQRAVHWIKSFEFFDSSERQAQNRADKARLDKWVSQSEVNSTLSQNGVQRDASKDFSRKEIQALDKHGNYVRAEKYIEGNNLSKRHPDILESFREDVKGAKRSLADWEIASRFSDAVKHFNDINGN